MTSQAAPAAVQVGGTLSWPHPRSSCSLRANVTGVRVLNNKTKEKMVVDVTGFFVAIGHTPNTDLFKGILDLHDNGYMKTKPGTAQTSLEVACTLTASWSCCAGAVSVVMLSGPNSG